MNRPLTVSITGGIGSGKSYVCRLLEDAGYPVYNADARAKNLMLENAELREQLMQAFGAETYHANGTLNREHLAQLVFNNEQQLQLLNDLVHPAVAHDFQQWVHQHTHKKAPPQFLFKESALVFEANIAHLTDVVVLVHAPENIRLARTRARDGMTEEEVRKRMAKQWPDERKLRLANFAIFNDGLQPVPPQLDAMLQFLSTFQPPSTAQHTSS